LTVFVSVTVNTFVIIIITLCLSPESVAASVIVFHVVRDVSQ